MVISEKCRELREKLGENAHEAAWIMEHITGIRYAISDDRELTAAEFAMADSILTRRKSGEPLQYILGDTEFMGMRFIVNRHTLIPRQDTETLVETAVSKIGDKPLRVLDIGTGSGCVGISIARLCKNAKVTLLDISKDALFIAQENARLNDVEVGIIQCDILHEMPDGGYDMIVSNPPYIETAVLKTLDSVVKDHEPSAALDGGEDGLVFYRRIARIFADIPVIAFEIGYDQGSAVSDILRGAGYERVSVIKDLCGNDRVVVAEKN